MGQPFTDRDVRNGRKVCLIGQTVAAELFGSESPIGKDLRVRNVPFKVVGVLSRKGADFLGWDQDDILLTPWTTIKYRVSGDRTDTTVQGGERPAVGAGNSSSAASSSGSSRPGSSLPGPVRSGPSRSAQLPGTAPPGRTGSIDRILIQSVSNRSIPTSIQEISDVLRSRHRIGPGELDDFRIQDMAEVAKIMHTIVRMLSGLLLSVALISLFVGGVGIMNIMLVSVTERTREIGVRMAVGANRRDIRRQFLVEAIVLCMLGGLIGIAVGRSASFLVRRLAQWPTEVSLPAIAAAVLVSVSVGVAFGYYPAWKASRLDPIDALRYE